MKLSIIVPVYNTEKYIVKCISSLLDQDYDDYEIIIVNDGSPDKAMEVLNNNLLSEKIIIINQENGGLSFARNEGMKLANGEYIWFVDSDDWIDQNCLNKICGQLDGCDVLYFNNYYDTTYSKERILSMNIDVRTGRELSKKDVKTPPMLYIYRRDFLTKAGHSFAVGMLHEDNLFTPIVLYTAQRVKPYNQPVYHKLSNPNSISHTINSQRCYDLMNVSNKLDMFAKEYVCKTDIWDWGHFIADTINGALAISLKCNSRVRHDLQDFVISHRYLLEYLCHSPKIPTKIMGWLSYKLCVPLVPLYQFLSIFRYKICFK